MATLFAKFAFYPTLAYGLFMTKVSARRWFDRIDDTVILGALPLRWIIKELIVSENVKGIVSVTEDFEMNQFVFTEQELQKFGVEQLRLQTVDYVGSPSQENIQKAVDFIQHHRQKEQSVYVHCKAGRTRSSTVVACYLIQVNGWTPEEAVDFIKTKRPHVWIREKQMSSIKTFYSRIGRSGQAS